MPGRSPARPPRFTLPTRAAGAARHQRFALAVSVAFHVALLVVLVATDSVRLPDLASLFEEPPAGARGERVVFLPIDALAGPRTTADPAAAIRASEAGPIAPPAENRGVPAPADRADEPGAGPPGAAPDAGAGNAGGSGGAPTSGTVASERFRRAVQALRPRSLSPLLNGGTIDGVRRDDERAAMRAYARIRALNDSILAEVEAGRRATDWTWTDEQGRRWGISPGKLHLGGIEIPLPVGTTSQTDRDLMREWQEIQAQAERGEIDETFDDRVEAIRAQRDAERSQE